MKGGLDDNRPKTRTHPMITIDELFGRKAAGADRPEDYIAWAVEQLVAGTESDSLALLASMDLQRPVDREDVLQCFFACVRERGVEIPSDEEALKTYSVILCRRISDGELDPREGLSRLARLYAASSYSGDLYAAWDYLEEDISLLETGYVSVFTPDLRRDNIDQHIKAAAAQHIALARSPLPGNFFRLTYCASCRRIGEPGNRPLDRRWIPAALYRRIFRRERAFEQICAECGASDLRTMYDYEGREQFLRLRGEDGQDT